MIAAFAVFWTAAGNRSLPGRWPTARALVALLVSVGVVWREYALLRAGIQGAGRFDGVAYGIAVTFEGVAISLNAPLLERSGKDAYILPAMVFIVGLHFFGLVGRCACCRSSQWHAYQSSACGTPTVVKLTGGMSRPASAARRFSDLRSSPNSEEGDKLHFGASSPWRRLRHPRKSLSGGRLKKTDDFRWEAAKCIGIARKK